MEMDDARSASPKKKLRRTFVQILILETRRGFGESGAVAFVARRET